MICSVIKNLILSWREHKISTLSAALAFYMVFSLAPILLISIAIAGLVLGPDAARGHLWAQISGLLGSDVALQIQIMIESANKPVTAVIANLIGIVLLLFGTTGLFSEIQSGLNTIWGVKDKSGRGLWGIVNDRFLLFTVVLGAAFFLLASMILTALFSIVSGKLGHFFGGELVMELISSDIISFVVSVLMFAMIFKILPNIEILWQEIWFGALVTALMFTFGKFLLVFYLSKIQVGLAFGASGSIIIILIWAYYSAQIFFIGAEITKIYATRKGKKLRLAI